MLVDAGDGVAKADVRLVGEAGGQSYDRDSVRRRLGDLRRVLTGGDAGEDDRVRVTAEPGLKRSLDGAERDSAIRMRRALLGALAPDRFPNVIASAGALAHCSDETGHITSTALPCWYPACQPGWMSP